MSNKAFVFDTNFIIQNHNLNDVVKNLNEKGFVVYITQVAIYERMLMYGKEASNRKQEIDRQHYTIPNQRPKDKHCGKI